jgi:hypothetical protein
MSCCDDEQDNDEIRASVSAKSHLNAPKPGTKNTKQTKPTSRNAAEQEQTALRSYGQAEIRSDQVRRAGGTQLSLGAEQHRNEISREKRPNGGEGESSRCVTSTAYLVAHVLVTHQ